MRTKREYVNASPEEARFWGYEQDEKGYFFEVTELSKEEQEFLSAQQNASYWKQFSQEEITQTIY